MIAGIQGSGTMPVGVAAWAFSNAAAAAITSMTR